MKHCRTCHYLKNHTGAEPCLSCIKGTSQGYDYPGWELLRIVVRTDGDNNQEIIKNKP